MAENRLRILAIGAHPDDCDLKAGGVAVLYRRLGHDVKFVSVTNGESGHHRLHGDELADIRRKEAAAAGEKLDIEYEVLDFRDGYLEPNVEARLKIIRLIRSYRPDLVLSHRPNDYHPDHRYTSLLVCDAAYMVTVPSVASDVPHLRENPVIAYFSDHFLRPYPFSPSVVVDIEPAVENVVDALDCHKSQFYEWLAYNHGYEDELPDDADDRRRWLGERYRSRIAPLADRHRPLVLQMYGSQRGSRVQYIEAFEPCEYGTPLTDENRRRLFPFLP